MSIKPFLLEVKKKSCLKTTVYMLLPTFTNKQQQSTRRKPASLERLVPNTKTPFISILKHHNGFIKPWELKNSFYKTIVFLQHTRPLMGTRLSTSKYLKSSSYLLPVCRLCVCVCVGVMCVCVCVHWGHRGLLCRSQTDAWVSHHPDAVAQCSGCAAVIICNYVPFFIRGPR